MTNPKSSPEDLVTVKKSVPKEYFFEVEIIEPYLTLKKPPLSFDKLKEVWNKALIKDGIIEESNA